MSDRPEVRSDRSARYSARPRSSVKFATPLASSNSTMSSRPVSPLVSSSVLTDALGITTTHRKFDYDDMVSETRLVTGPVESEDSDEYGDIVEYVEDEYPQYKYDIRTNSMKDFIRIILVVNHNGKAEEFDVVIHPKETITTLLKLISKTVGKAYTMPIVKELESYLNCDGCVSDQLRDLSKIVCSCANGECHF